MALMTLKVTLTVDQDHGEQLVGLLAKAFGRGELGIGDIRIERADPLDVGLKAIKQSLGKLPEATAKWIGKPKKARAEIMPRKGTGAFLGLVVVASGVPAPNKMVREAFLKAGLSANGAAATLSKLGKRGYLRHAGDGEWKLTAKGEEALKKGEQHDSPNSE
jgi:hypothetical protein